MRRKGDRAAWRALIASSLLVVCPSGAAHSDELSLAADEGPPRGYSLRVRVTDLESDRGRVAVALFDSEEDFPDQARALRGALSPIAEGGAQVVFRGVKPGVYAVAVLHDENENSKMDFNFLGIPLEGYGFSNDARATFGPPAFEEAAFRLKPRASVISIEMRYFSL